MALRLKLEDISYSYPLPGREESPALSGISLEIEPGEVLCVAGANGSGKSTLAQVCAGLLVPSSGRLSYGDEPIEGRAALLGLRHRICLVFQSPEEQLFADSVERDIAFGPRNHGLKGEDLAARVREAAAVMGVPLDSAGKRSPFSLSEGEKRRVALAGVLALSPEVIILDEPFIGLDFEGREHLKTALDAYRASRDTSVVIVTHDLSECWRLADRFALLSKGRLVSVVGRPELLGSVCELQEIGMRLPQWGALAEGMERLGILADDPSDPGTLASAIFAYREAGLGR